MIAKPEDVVRSRLVPKWSRGKPYSSPATAALDQLIRERDEARATSRLWAEDYAKLHILASKAQTEAARYREALERAQELIREVNADFSLAMPFVAGERGSKAQWSWHERAHAALNVEVGGKPTIPANDPTSTPSPDRCPECGHVPQDRWRPDVCSIIWCPCRNACHRRRGDW